MLVAVATDTQCAPVGRRATSRAMDPPNLTPTPPILLLYAPNLGGGKVISPRYDRFLSKA